MTHRCVVRLRMQVLAFHKDALHGMEAIKPTNRCGCDLTGLCSLPPMFLRSPSRHQRCRVRQNDGWCRWRLWQLCWRRNISRVKRRDFICNQSLPWLSSACSYVTVKQANVTQSSSRYKLWRNYRIAVFNHSTSLARKAARTTWNKTKTEIK